MTGFGSAAGTSAELGVSLRAEISSINRKQFELKCALPREISIYENSLRRLIAGKVNRGSLLLRVELIPCVPGNDPASGSLNDVLARRLCEKARELAQETGLDPAVTAAVLTVPAVSEGLSALPNGPELEQMLLKTVSDAVDDLYRMRTTEGMRLCEDLKARLALLESTLTEIEPLVAELPKQQYERLLARVREAGFVADCSDERFLRELVIFTDKSDVTEELVRLKSHFAHFRELADREEEAAGRSLDFLMQEIFREVNTLGNKAPLPEVSRRIVTMKTEVEKMREQVQNVE